MSAAASSPLPDLLMKDAALAAATNGIVIVDALADDHPLIYANEGFERLTGYDADEIIGRNCRLLQGPGTSDAAVAEMRRILAERRSGKVTLLNYRKDGTPFWNEVVLSPVSEGGRIVQYVGVQLDVTERRRAEEQVAFLAYHDALTGLANRARVEERLTAAVAEGRRAGREVALVFVDLDDFKSINDRFGHAAGDELLRQVTERLTGLVRPRDVLARQGGDEFLLILGDLPEGAQALGADVAHRIVETFTTPFLLQGDLVPVGASVGVSAFPAEAQSAQELLHHADIAMYTAKRRGGNRYAAATAPGAAPAARPEPAVPAAEAAEELTRILRERLLVSAYQPIVDLQTGEVVAYEALARGPEGSVLHRPDRLFQAARATGRLEALEWACRAAALRGALDAGLRSPLSLFVNVEPSMLASPVPDEVRGLLERARSEFDVVMELTERALADKPRDVVAAVPALRALGCAVALDDVGADRRSLALMPFVEPEIIKLDLRLVQSNPTPEIASIVHAVNAEVERSGALLLAEGIETEAHKLVARAQGARLGQGWLFGRPGPLPAAPASVVRRRLAPPRPARRTNDPTPFQLVAERLEPRRGTKRLLLAISKHIEAQVAARSDAMVLLATFQEARHFTPATAARYRRLGQSGALVGALGVGLPEEPVPGVRGAALDNAEPLRGEWNVIALDPHFAAAFVATDLGDTDCADMERRFDFCLTYDRELVVRAARVMMERLAPRESGE